MDYARQSQRCLVFPGRGQLSQEPTGDRIGLDLISSVDLSRVTGALAAGPQRAEPLPPPFLPLLQTTLIKVAQFFKDFLT